MNIEKKGEQGFIKEIAIIAIVILTLAYFSIDVQEVALHIKAFFAWIISLFK